MFFLRSSAWEEHHVAIKTGSRKARGRLRKIGSLSPTSKSTGMGTGGPFLKMQVLCSWGVSAQFPTRILGVIFMFPPLLFYVRAAEMRQELPATMDQLSETRYQEGDVLLGRRGDDHSPPQHAGKQVSRWKFPHTVIFFFLFQLKNELHT